ncbi:glycosyltransferase [Alloyangia pacifica]|uniref:glycosyltransferase n=1 Tax=Alloyangia pacifica TaxID=311180 RepID=UPI0031D1912C
MSLSNFPLQSKLRSAARRLLKGQASGNSHQFHGPFRGHVDGLSEEGVIRGWVIHNETKKGRVPVGLYAGGTLLDAGVADSLREDVGAATGGEVACGFRFGVSDALYQKVEQLGGVVSIRTEGAQRVELGQVKLAGDGTNPGVGADTMTRCRFALKRELAAMLELLEATPVPEGPLAPVVQPPFSRHGIMFGTDRLIPEIPESGQPAYLDYVRFRYRMDEKFPVEKGLENADRFLYWYLTAYRGQEKHRTPLAAEQIDYLNAPQVMGGQSHTLSRIMWWRLAARPDLLGELNLNDRDSYLDTLFWWAHQDAPHLYFEDCLVPDRFADALRGVHPSRRLDTFPLSYFSERYFLDSPKLQFLAPGTAEGRKTLMLAILLHAAQRPDLLRYVPRGQTAKLLGENPENENGASDFEIFVNELAALPEPGADEPTGPHTHIALPRARYAAALRRKFFDLDSYSFLTRDREGNRFEAAAMPIPEPDRPEVEVQLIGPLAKASGLGQATRLSAAILRETGLDVRGVDFDLDNPAPEGFSSETLIEDYGPAKINLIHLNAESTPLAFAYQPDVFSGAYNIGYFYWELDKPAYCHYLGMELLDEIWVSTEYGVQIYKQDAKGKPVVNVGMCYEEHPDITREAARAFVNRRFRFDESHYVCLVAFDSFSFVQRKNPVAVLEAFQKAFEGVPNARLVVKTQNRDSIFDPVQVNLWDRVDALMASDPRIVVMNETLSYRDLLQLKAGSDCYISLHKSEGWGFGMIEAMALKVPVVCTAYSGNMDFCSDETAWMVGYEEVTLKQGDYIFVRPGAVWAEPSVEEAARQMRAAYDDETTRLAKAEAAYAHIRESFSAPAIAKLYGGRLREILAELDARA